MCSDKKRCDNSQYVRMAKLKATDLMRILCSSIAFCVAMFSDLNAQESRVWQTADGKHSVEAVLVSQKGNRVRLRKKDGRIVEVPIQLLSQQDQDFATQATSNAAKKTLQAVTGDEIDRQMQRLASDHGLATLNGLPVVRLEHFLDSSKRNLSDNNRKHYQQADEQLIHEQAALGKFLERVVLGVDPTYFDKNLPTFIANHLPKNISENYIQYRFQTGGAVGVWKGKDEFQKRESQQAFKQNHSKHLANIAIETPIRLRFVSKCRFSSYDFARKGLVVGALNKSHSPVVPGLEWVDAMPTLASTGYDRKRMNAVVAPFQGSTFWKVDPSIARTLPSKSHSMLGRNQTERWAFVSTIVTFRSVPLLGKVNQEEPAFFAKVESVRLYAEPTLETLLHRFDLNQFPEPVLLTGNDQMVDVKDQSIPLDELALAGLAAHNPSIELHPKFWGDFWGHISKQDEEHYAALSKAANGSFQASMSFANAAQSNRVLDTDQLKRATNNLAGLHARVDELMNPNRRPFFPTFTGRSGRFSHVGAETLSGQQREHLTNWLVKRNQMVDNRFQILVRVKLNGNTDEPTVIDYPINKELQAKLQHLGFNPDHYYSLDENLAFDERRRMSQKGTRTDLFRAPSPQYKSFQFLLDFGFPVDTLVRKLPKEVVDKSLAMKSDEIPIAVNLEFQVDSLKPYENLLGAKPYVVLKATPTRLSALSDVHTVIFDESLDVDSLNKLAADEPMKPIPMSASNVFTPQSVLPLIGKIAPDYFENKQLLDQLMVMRWRFENVGISDVATDGVRFFKKGAQQLPTYEERKAHADQFKAWALRWSEAMPKDMTIQFENFRFNGMDKNTPSPALIAGSDPGFWQTGIGYQFSGVIYNLNHPERINPEMKSEEVNALLELFSIAPRDVQLDRVFAIPDAKGNTFKTNTLDNQRIAGLPVANHTEPIFPLIRFDKEIWPPENPELAVSTQKPKLEVVLEPESLELLDKLPRHHWIDGYWRFRRSHPLDDRIKDDGKYAIFKVRLKSARLVDPATGKTILPLELKAYRTIKEKIDVEETRPTPVKEAKSQMKEFDKSIAGVRLGMSFQEAEQSIKNTMDIGLVLTAERLIPQQPTAADIRRMKPYTSGRLFVSKDGRQYMAIFDEPPAANRKVVAMWMRRHVSDQEMEKRLWRGSLIRSLTKQYGNASENYGESVAGLPVGSFWRQKRHSTQNLALPSGRGKESLWLENGERTSWRPPGQVKEGAKFSTYANMFLPELLPNDLASLSGQPPGHAKILDDAIIIASGPALGSRIEMPSWGAGGSRSPDDSLNPMVTTWIVDPPTYIKYFRESQRMVEVSK